MFCAAASNGDFFMLDSLSISWVYSVNITLDKKFQPESGRSILIKDFWGLSVIIIIG